jgi:hypothetical protein
MRLFDSQYASHASRQLLSHAGVQHQTPKSELQKTKKQTPLREISSKAHCTTSHLIPNCHGFVNQTRTHQLRGAQLLFGVEEMRQRGSKCIGQK